MAGVNKVILVGNLGRDPEVRRLGSGDPVVNFSVATSETWRDKQSGERREKTEWHNVVIFNENLGQGRRAISAQGLEGLHRGPAADAPVGGPAGPETLHDGDRAAEVSRRAADARQPRRRRRRDRGSQRARRRFRQFRADGPRRPEFRREIGRPGQRGDGRRDTVLSPNGSDAKWRSLLTVRQGRDA